MKKLLVSTAVALSLGSVASTASAEEIKLGVFLGLTGPIESLVANMAPAAEAAIAEVSASGLLLDGTTVSAVRADTTCVDAAAATAAIERLITSDKVSGVVGGDCSGVTTAALSNVALPNGMVMVSPSATSPALSTVEDGGLFFRTAPSDARQGVVMTEIIMDRGFKEVAVTYTNNDYGKGLADAFQSAFEEAGGSVTISASHEDGKADYAAEVGALAAAGGELLVVAGYLDQGGKVSFKAHWTQGRLTHSYCPMAWSVTPCLKPLARI
jgi:branched-chain amino acid transport system substrate-binding protein